MRTFCHLIGPEQWYLSILGIREIPLMIFQNCLIFKYNNFKISLQIILLPISRCHFVKFGVTSLLRPESFSSSLSYLNLVIPAWFKKEKPYFEEESKTLKYSHRANGLLTLLERKKRCRVFLSDNGFWTLASISLFRQSIRMQSLNIKKNHFNTTQRNN